MIDINELKRNLSALEMKSIEEEFVVGYGVQANTRIGFDVAKLDEKKHEVASILHEIGADKSIIINLDALTKDKDGNRWNNLQSVEDFKVLELLLACSHACGFILNDYDTIKRNKAELGEKDSVAISGEGIKYYGSEEKWLEAIRETVINNMWFFTNAKMIRDYASGTILDDEAPKFGGK